MCGVCGIYDLSGKIDRNSFCRMRDTMAHRGPDDEGAYFSEDGKIALGFRRLAIIDISPNAQQPIQNENGKISLVCNGEIYNYPEIKALLLSFGHIFKTTSDAEVIVHGYEEWGTEVFSHLNGMFALALFDETKNSLILARDRFGIKPLYYQIVGQKIIFASELRPIVANNACEIDPKSLINFLIYRYVPTPASIYKNTWKLLSAHFMVCDSNLQISTNRYWEIESGETKAKPEEICEHAGLLINRSVSEHLRSAVPVGTFLSGGYDSSLIAVLMKENNFNPIAFSLGFDGWDASEDEFACEVAHKLHITLITDKISKEDFLNEEIISAWDEPIADISIIPSYYVSKLASQTHKVVLSGDGADEVFAGYNWYYDVAQQLASQKKSVFLRQQSHKIAFETYCRYTSMGFFDRAELKKTLNPEFHKNIPDDVFWNYRQHFNTKLPVIKALQLLDLKTFMPELILTKMDRASMANSLEVRVPFLDHRIAEFILKHESGSYFDKNQYKTIIHGLLKNKVPESILNRKKQGFTGPDSYYSNLNFYITVFSKSKLIENGIVNKSAIDVMLSRSDYWRLWKLAVLEMWFKKFTA